MKRLFLLIPLILAVILSLYPDEVRARSESGIRGRAYGRTRGWRNQGWSRAPRMSGPGYRLSPSIRGPGYDKSLGYGYRPRYQKPREILRENDARNIVHHYLSSSGNPGMKVGTITERAYYFEVEILTEKNTAAHKIAVDKRTGWMGSIN